MKLQIFVPRYKETEDIIKPLLDSTNPYMIGGKVSYNGKTYISIVDNNVWVPNVYGWQLV